MTQEQWADLDEFPDYAVSDQGSVVNMKTGAPRRASINQQGVVNLSLYDKNGRITSRSVALLVANAFVPGKDSLNNTPIHLDGNKQNCRADNLMWRPRWYAIKYHRQFFQEEFHNQDVYIVDTESGAEYHSLKEACIANGLYWYDVVKSYTENTFTPITFQAFRLV